MRANFINFDRDSHVFTSRFEGLDSSIITDENGISYKKIVDNNSYYDDVIRSLVIDKKFDKSHYSNEGNKLSVLKSGNISLNGNEYFLCLDKGADSHGYDTFFSNRADQYERIGIELIDGGLRIYDIFDPGVFSGEYTCNELFDLF